MGIDRLLTGVILQVVLKTELWGISQAPCKWITVFCLERL